MTKGDGDGAGQIGQVTRLMGRLGFTAFGGPAAHIAMMHDEVVTRRGWMDDQRFVDLVGVTNLIPGPNSTEMAMHIGHERAGWRGLLAGGAAFILPAAAITLVLAWLYVEYGTTPRGEALLRGVKPVVVIIVAQALLKLGRSTLRGWRRGLVAVAALAAYLAGANELVILAGGAAVVFALRRAGAAGRAAPLFVPGAGGRGWLGGGLVASWLAAEGDAGAISLGRLFLVFFKAGALLYGSGYVLLAFLENDLVRGLGVLTQDQLIDAVAIGQLTPGPVFTTATFVGYVLAGVPGAAVATAGIFLPSFLLVGAVTPLARRVRDREWTAALLDGVNAAALGLMAGVTLILAGDAFVDPLSLALAAAAALILWRTRLNTAWLILVGALVGLVASSL